MIISLIAAIDENLGIGRGGDLLCRLPADMKLFREHTTGHPVIMGRKTFESMQNKPLKNRLNIILTSRKMEEDGFITASTIEEALQKTGAGKDEEVFVIGGGVLFRDILPQADRLYLTHIKHSFEADTFFPPVNMADWKATSCQDHTADEKNPYDFRFCIYERAVKAR